MDDSAKIPYHLDVIRAKLARLRERDSRHAIFGSETHRYALGRCSTDDQIRAVEEEYGIRFPEGYRHFLLHMGNGGAGPGYGLLTLQASVRDRRGGHLAQPFPAMFVAPPSDADEERGGAEGRDAPDDLDPLWQDSRRPDARCEWVRDIRERERDALSLSGDAGAEEVGTWDAEGRRSGAVEVAHYGCGIMAVLVVSGPERGTIWIDDPNSSFGCDLYPIGRGGWMGQAGWERIAAHPEKRLDFLSWYDDWLDGALVTLDQ